MTVSIPADKRHPELPAASHQPQGAIHRQPVTFHGLFGWLHTSPAHPPGDVAVLICPAITRDGLDSHLALRVLADELAAAGYPALRFNYPGTGDSLDAADTDFAADNQFQSWLASVHAAADWLKTTTGAHRLILAGLRFGATIAALAAEPRTDIAGLLLLAPVLRGKSYLRQLWVETKLRTGGAKPLAEGLQCHELNFDSQSVALIEEIDLRQIKPPAGVHIALFLQADSAPIAECVNLWGARGASVQSFGFDRLEPMLQHNLQGESAPLDLSAIAEWLRHAVPAHPAQQPMACAIAPAIIHRGDLTDTPIHFGPAGKLFGMLCQPANDLGNLAVIICNSGQNAHYGDARFGTELARQLAHHGIASLRFDFEGLGDSIGGPGKENLISPMLEVNRNADVAAAIDAMATRGYQNFAAHGLCSGAYHSLHAALADHRIQTLLLVNMAEFMWEKGEVIEFNLRRGLPPSYYMRRFIRKQFWNDLIHFRLNIGGIISAQSSRITDRLRRAAGRRLNRASGSDTSDNFAHQAMTTLTARGVRALCLYGPEDPGNFIIEKYFGPGGIELKKFKSVAMRVIDGFDHGMSVASARQTAGEMIIDFLHGK